MKKLYGSASRLIRGAIILFAVIASAAKQSHAQSPNYLWATSAGGTNTDEGRSCATDVNGNIFVTGYFRSLSITFGTTTLTNAGDYDIFIVKYDANGNVLWAKSAGGTGDDRGNSCSTDANGNVFVTGYFKSFVITFDTTYLYNDGDEDIFIAKYDTLGNVLWATGVGGSDKERGNGCSTDANGNVFVTGSYKSSPITFGTITLWNSNSSYVNEYNIFIVKYDFIGNVLWAKQAGDINYSELSNSCSTDANGNVFVTGFFLGPFLNFGTDTLTNAGGGQPDIFIVKYDQSGNVLWAKSAGGTNSALGTSVSTDAGGNVFVTGYFFSPTITFGTTTLTNAGFGDIFIVKYDALGNIFWAKSAGGTADDWGTSVSTDAGGNVFVTGYFYSDTITFGTTTLTNADNTGNTADIFIVKYDAAGTVLWAKSAGGTNYDVGLSCSTDFNGNIFVTGYFRSSSITFGTITLTNTTAISSEIYIVKYDSSGNVLWAKSGGGTDNDSGRSVSTDASGNVYVTGSFLSSSITFGTTTLTNAGYSDLFIVKYDANGNVLWAKSAGGTNSDYGNSCSTDSSGNIFVTGAFYSSSITFGTTTLTNAGGYDIFIVKHASCSNSSFSQSPTICIGDSITVGNNTYTTSGTYVDILTAANGCDSTVTTNLTVSSSINISQNPIICSGQSVTIGSNTYSASGTYQDTLVATGGCDSIVTTNLTVLPANTFNQTITLCFGQTLTVGSNTYTVSGTYTDVLTAANGCDSTVTSNLTILPSNTFSQTITLCFGQTLTVGSNTYTVSGTYNDTLTAANGCDSIVTTNLTVLTVITNSFVITTPTCGNNNGSVSATPSGGGGTYTFLWSNGDTTSTVTGLTGQPADTLILTITDTNGCTLTDTAIVNCVTDVSQYSNLNTQISISPNPTSGTFQVKSQKSKVKSVEIYNVLGERIYSSSAISHSSLVTTPVTNAPVTIDLSSHPSGIYFLHLKTEQGTAAKKLIINK